MAIDISKLSLKELKDLQAQVAKAITGYEEQKRRAALTELEETARRLGFTLSELAGAAIPKKRAPAAPKYANPENRNETWTGRGRKPKWMEAALRAGKSPDDLLI